MFCSYRFLLHFVWVNHLVFFCQGNFSWSFVNVYTRQSCNRKVNIGISLSCRSNRWPWSVHECSCSRTTLFSYCFQILEFHFSQICVIIKIMIANLSSVFKNFALEYDVIRATIVVRINQSGVFVQNSRFFQKFLQFWQLSKRTIYTTKRLAEITPITH